MTDPALTPKFAAAIDPATFRQIMTRELGSTYIEFRNGLAPDYRRVLFDIGMGYGALILWMAIIGQANGLLFGLGAAAIGAVGVGFLIAYLQLFIHEAAHYNLAANRDDNDRLADWLISWQVGTSIAAYRATHFDHHRHFGVEGDTEVSYRHALSVKFIIDMLTGIHALRVFSNRKVVSAGKASKTSSASRLPLVRGLCIHFVIIVASFLAGWWPAALAWVGGMAIAFPFFATLRQLLEHRPIGAMRDEAYGTNRLFEDSAFARIFGGAGFNRHLLHHLEPQVSYTRFAEFERFLMATSLAPILDAHRATYFGTLGQLLNEPAA
jgi:fatty acid desaturase